MQSRAILIDGNALIHRAWHALPRLTSPDGRVVNAVYGFTMTLFKLLEREKPEYLVVCWDTPEPTYRHELAPEYKAQRIEQPQEFYDQFPLVRDVIEAMGGKNIELPGYEADDLLATLGAIFAKQKIETRILTSDRDVWQAIGSHVSVLAFQKGVTETIVYTEKTLRERIGLTPKQIVEWKALVGDPSDNLKGVPGIGEKTAQDLVVRFGSLEQILIAAKDPTSDLAPSVRRKLLDGEDAARKTRKLVELIFDAPIQLSVDELHRTPVHEEMLREIFLQLGFQRLLSYLPSSTHQSSKPQSAIASRQVTPQEVLEEAIRARVLYLLPLQTTQTSFFSSSPELALGSKTKDALVTTTDLEQRELKESLAEVLRDPSVAKVGHDLKSVWHWCRKRNLELNGIGFDTLIAAYLLSAGEREYTLEILAAQRLNQPSRKSDDRPIFETAAIRSLHALLEQELKDKQLTTIHERFELPLIPILGQMETRGILIDRPYFVTLQKEFQKEKSSIEQEMVKLAGEAFNPASPIQLARILFEVLKLPTKGIKRGKTGISTAASELEKLEGAHPIIEKVSDYREIAKLLSTYVEALPTLADVSDRVHTTFHQTIAATGRLSSTNPNLQNIPIRTELGRKIRRGFIAPKGYLLLSCDYSQIELRVIAALAKDEKMLEAFRRGVDIHTATAAAIWHVPLDEVTKEQRRAAKAINFGIVYGQGPQGLSRVAGISFEEAKQFIEEYFHVYSGIREYLEQTKALAHTRGYVETLFGRRRPIPDINSPRPEIRAAAERMAINMPVQGTAADLMKLAMIKMTNVKMLLQVHDELVFEVPENEISRIVPHVIDLMENVEKIGVPIVVEAKVGKNWEEMDKV